MDINICKNILHTYRVDADFSAKAKAQTLHDGTTAVIAIIHQNRVIVGNGSAVAFHLSVLSFT